MARKRKERVKKRRKRVGTKTSSSSGGMFGSSKGSKGGIGW
jgi:hypothetical protein